MSNRGSHSTAVADAMKVAEDKICEEARLKAEFDKQETFLNRLVDSTCFTPDVGRLEARTKWMLFVPDECMAAHYDHARLGINAKRISEAVTVDTFTLWKQRSERTATAIPLRIQYGQESPSWRDGERSKTVALRLPIRGELYFVNAATLIKLDHHRENGVRFARERVQVQIPSTQIQLKKIPLSIEKETPVTTFVREENRVLGDPVNVWMYVGILEYWEPLLDNGHTFALTRRFKPHNQLLRNYYYFSPEEHVSQ